MKQTQRINIRRKQSCIYDVIYHVKNLMKTKILLAVVSNYQGHNIQC